MALVQGKAPFRAALIDIGYAVMRGGAIERQPHHQRTPRRQPVPSMQRDDEKVRLSVGVHILQVERQHFEVPDLALGQQRDLDLRLRPVGDELVMLGVIGKHLLRQLHAHQRLRLFFQRRRALRPPLLGRSPMRTKGEDHPHKQSRQYLLFHSLLFSLSHFWGAVSFETHAVNWKRQCDTPHPVPESA